MSQAAAVDNARAPASAPSPAAAAAAAAPDLRLSDLDPLLKDLSEKKQSFRRGVVSLAAELKDVRGRLASQEASFAREILSRQVAEKRAKTMEEEICRLQRSLEEKDVRLHASTSPAEQYLKDFEDLKDELSVAQAAAEASALSAQSAEAQCLFLLKELEEKNSCLKAHEERVNKLIEQLDILQKDLQSRELSQNQLKDEVTRIEREIMEAVAKVGTDKNGELLKILGEVSPKNLHNLNKHLTAKDEEIARLKDEIGFISAHWKHKTKDLEYQLEKHRRADQELKKRVLKLEFCLQETRARTRKLQRMGEKREKVLKELREQLTMKEQAGGRSQGKPNFWESSGFKLIVSMSMLVLVVFAKR